MGCGGSKPAGEAGDPAVSSKVGLPPGRSLQREETSFLKKSEAGPDLYVPGAGGGSRLVKQRTRSRSVDFTASGSALVPNLSGDSLSSVGMTSNRVVGRSRRSQSLSTQHGAFRIHAYVVAKETGGRKAGRVAVTAEGNLELRTQLARHQGNHAQFTPEQATFVLDTIREHFLFRNMSQEQQTRMVSHFERRNLAAGDVVTKQGEEGAREFFVVVEGTLEVSVIKTGESKPTVVATVRAQPGVCRNAARTQRARPIPSPLGTPPLRLLRGAR